LLPMILCDLQSCSLAEHGSSPQRLLDASINRPRDRVLGVWNLAFFLLLAINQMHLSHSNSGRNKSRSPAPPNSPFPSSSRPSNFFPPSHYAAAAGIPYPTRPPTSQDAMISEPSDGKRDSFVPISYPSQSLSSDSSFEFKATSLPQYSTSPSTPKSKRLGNIPHLETLLIPSLRDTIDRMTRPPSLINSPGSAHLDLPTRGVGRSSSPSFSSATSAAPSFSSTSSAGSALSYSSPSFSRHRYPPQSPSAPVPSGGSSRPPPPLTFLSSTSPPNTGSYQSAPTTPTQKPKAKPKPALKSALRPPTPKVIIESTNSPLRTTKSVTASGTGSTNNTKTFAFTSDVAKVYCIPYFGVYGVI
jgi:hypothetical protein